MVVPNHLHLFARGKLGFVDSLTRLVSVILPSWSDVLSSQDYMKKNQSLVRTMIDGRFFSTMNDAIKEVSMQVTVIRIDS